jgi:hypothetical protein
VSDPEAATRTQLANMEVRAGRSLDELLAAVAAWGPLKHGQIVARAKEAFALGHGDANLLAHLYRRSQEAPPDTVPDADPTAAALAGIYAGNRAMLRPLHDLVMARIESLGPFEIAPKKAYLSLRRRRQFATVGPGTRGRLEIGINDRGAEATERLEALGPGAMCTHRIHVTEESEIDEELLDHVRAAYLASG